MCAQPYPSISSLEPMLFDRRHPVLECLTALSYRSGDLGAYLTDIALGVSRFLQCDWTIVTVCEKETGQIVASSLDIQWDDAGFSVPGTLAGEVVQSGRSLIIEDSRRTLRQHQLPKEYPCYLGVPLRTASGAVIGTICSFLRDPRPFTEAEIKIIELFAERAATAIENYQLYQQQQQFNERLSQAVTACSIDLKLSQEKLIERERLAAIGEFTAMIVHEVRNPLTTIQMGLRHAQKVLYSDADQQRLALASSEAERLNHLLNEILCYAKPQVLELKKINVSEFLNELLVQIQALPEALERYIDYEKGAPEIEVMADINKLRQVFLNLFRNALEAIPPHETVSCWLWDDGPANRLGISIHNGGTPIPPALLPQITTPFCTTKPSGTGLGLAIAQRIITAHQGELVITSNSTGTTVNIYLPIRISFEG
jgi:signal transduction histidine kinase